MLDSTSSPTSWSATFELTALHSIWRSLSIVIWHKTWVKKSFPYSWKKTRIFIGIQEVNKTTRWFDKSWFQHNDVLGPAKWKTDRHVLDITVH